MNTIPKIALGAWFWGAGAAGGDQVFGNHLPHKSAASWAIPYLETNLWRN